MINAVIIEDEKPSARRLNRMLEKQEVNVVATLHSVEEAVQWFIGNPHPDVVFLDIQLSDGLSFEIFEKVEVKCAIIFTTAYDEYALKAFKLNSVDYLLKPIDEEELEAAIKKFETNHNANKQQFDVNQFRAILNQSQKPAYKTRFTVQVGQHLKVLETEEINCFYSENKATYIHTNAGRSYLIDQSLEALEQDLNPDQFIRINRKSIVNYKAIKDIVSYTNSRLELKLKQTVDFPLIVSRERVKEFKDWLG